MGRNTEGAGKATAIGIALVSVVGISAARCGGGDDDVTQANYVPKVIAALCGAEAACCASQGFPQSADARQLCEQTTPFVVGGLTGEVFNHDIAVACVKAAQAYHCRGLPSIDDLCRRVYSDPAYPATAPLGAEGATCALLDFPFTCAFYDGLTCVPDSATSTIGTCRKLLMSGASCKYNWDCVAATDYCDRVAMTCMPWHADGAACDAALFQCESGTCTNGVCAPRAGCTLE